MQDAVLPLDPTKPASFVGSDGRLQVEVPTGAVTAADVSAAGGALALQIRQIAPASGSTAGGSGHVSLGTYLLQVVDSTGHLVSHGLRQPVSVAMHLRRQEGALDLAHAFLLVNGSLPEGITLNPGSAPSALSTSAASIGRRTVVPLKLAATRASRASATSGSPSARSTTPQTTAAPAQTLSAPLSLSSPSTGISFDTDSPVATFGRPDPFNVDLSAGSMTAGYPIDLPAGAGGFRPPLTLAYSSASIAEQHNPQAAASWVGEGWNLTPGAITWAEHNATSGGSNPTWEDSWQLNDPFGSSVELVPSNINVSTYYEDANGSAISPSPQTWHTAPEIHARVISFTPPVSTANPAAVSWGPNRIDVFIRGTDNQLYHRYFDNNAWSSWQQIAANMTSSPAATTWGQNRLDVFGRGTDNALYHISSSDGGSTWSAWSRIAATMTSDPAAVSWGANRIDVVANGTNSAAYHTWTTDGGSTWQPWQSLGGSLTSSPTISSWGASRLDVFARGGDNAVYQETSTDGVTFSSWQRLGGNLSSGPAAVSWGSNRIDVFARGQDLAMYQLTYDTGGWHTWTLVGGSLNSGAAPASWASGHLDVFGIGQDGGLYQITYDQGAWNTWQLVTRGRPTGMAAIGPCFRVFLPSGVMEEFGCTPDSYQFYPEPSGGNAGLDYVSAWLLDLVTDPRGNQVHYTYQQDLQTGAGGHQYPRDAQLSTIEWDSPGCRSTVAACLGSQWAPLMRVNFVASHTARLSSGSCSANGSLRCDDPVDLSGSGGLPAPTIQSTFVLNDVQVQVRGSGTASWNPLRDYQLSYVQGGPQTIVDPPTGKTQSVAGQLVLTRLTEIGDDNSTSLPTRSFDYTSLVQYYEDDQFHPTPSTNCGPSWNTGTGSGCLLWSQSYNGNSYYLSSANNGMGLQQSFTWANARNNTHGVNAGSNLNPLACTTQATYPCNEADDQNWSHAVLTQDTGTVNQVTQNGQGGQQTTTGITSTTTYTYSLSTFTANPCPDCVQGFTWGNQNDNDYLDFYNGKFMGFRQTSITKPDSSREVHNYNATEGWGLYDITQIQCYTPNPCHNAPWWDLINVAHGHEYETDWYDTNGTTLLRDSQPQYSAVCPPSGVSGTPPGSWGNWNGNLVSELDHNNPVAACDLQTSRRDDIIKDGSSNPTSVAALTTIYGYDSYGRVISEARSSNDGGGTGSATAIVQKTAYVWNDSVSATPISAAGTYLIDFPSLATTEDTSGNRAACTYSSYDGQAYASGQSGFLTLGEITQVERDTNCGTAPNFTDRSGPLVTTHTYDPYGNLLTTNDPDANAGNSAHLGCIVSGTQYSTCQAVDPTFAVLPTSTTNSLNQLNRTAYQSPASGTAAGGFGLWPISTQDVNGQTTSYAYDYLGRLTSQTLPNETQGLATTSHAYAAWCSGSGAQIPCLEVDTTQRLNDTTTVTSRAFYDGWGHLVETRVPAPNSQDVVRYALYDASGRLAQESVPYFVAVYSGGPGAAAYSIPDSSQPVSTHAYDGLGRLTSTTDPLLDRTSNTISVVCNAPGTGDTACYEQTLTVDALGHQGGGLVDAFGRKQYLQRFTGNSPATYAVYATTKHTYDLTGNLTQLLQPDGTSRTTFAYDMAGRKTGMTDPDLGQVTHSYDQDGNATQSVDARGAGGTVYVGYDGIDRPLWRNSTNSPTGAYETFSYDSTANGNQGVGRLTSETFTRGPNNSLSGSYAYVYDARGQQTKATLAVGGTNYPVQNTFDDAGNTLTQIYPTNETVTTGYTGQGWLSSLSTTQGNTSLLSGAAYTGFGGAARRLTSASLGGGQYQYTASFDALLRATDIKTANGGTTLFEQSRNFDAAGNVTSASTTLPAGTDNQAFCYDEQDRLTWAGAAGTPPCGVGLTPGSLTAAQYTQSFSYDNLGRLTSGPLGSYTYGDNAHLHAVTAIGGAYTAAYDPAGDMTCRAPSSSTTCVGTQTGAQLTYDPEGSLAAWQNAPGTPTSSAGFLYDNQGNRVEQQVTQNGTTTTTVYVGNMEQVATTGASTTTTTYYYAGSARIALAVTQNATTSFSYLAADGLGSANVALNASGSATASTLYAPYGGARYSSGTMPTDYGFTGQHSDAATGLDYYNARYYDPVAGQFTTADTMLPGNGYDILGLSRYAYVEGNPETRTDITGHDSIFDRAQAAVGGFLYDPPQWAFNFPGVYENYLVAHVVAQIPTDQQDAFAFASLGLGAPIVAEARLEAAALRAEAAAARVAAARAVAARAAAARAVAEDASLLPPYPGAGPGAALRDFPTKSTYNWSAWMASERDARALARRMVGSGPIEIEPGKFRSVSGKWQYRAYPGDLAGDSMGPHIHLEELDPTTGEVRQNLHLRWTAT